MGTSIWSFSNSGEDGDNFGDQVKTGKLNVTNLYPNNQREEAVKGEIKIGKLNTKVRKIFSDQVDFAFCMCDRYLESPLTILVMAKMYSNCHCCKQQQLFQILTILFILGDVQ